MDAPLVPGPLALVGGDELNPGNEAQDRILVAAAGEGPSFVLATATARGHAGAAVRHATEWFGRLGLDVEELPAIRRRDVTSAQITARARQGKFFYLVGGDPGKVPTTLAGTPLWESIIAAWLDGAALAGSSAGAMALGEWSLTSGGDASHAGRRFAAGLRVVPNIAVIPHLDTFGEGWLAGALAGRPREDAVLVGIDERSAALWQDGRWRAYGPGGVTVFTNGTSSRFQDGEVIEGMPMPSLDSGGPTDRSGT